MGWAVGERNGRWIGYGVPAWCDEPGCDEKIDRGLAYICDDGGVGEFGCGRFFCFEHGGGWFCVRCRNGEPSCPPKPDHPDWIAHMETDESWAEWRAERDAKAKGAKP